jgi:hypothetical protein
MLAQLHSTVTHQPGTAQACCYANWQRGQLIYERYVINVCVGLAQLTAAL